MRLPANIGLRQARLELAPRRAVADEHQPRSRPRGERRLAGRGEGRQVLLGGKAPDVEEHRIAAGRRAPARAQALIAARAGSKSLRVDAARR